MKARPEQFQSRDRTWQPKALTPAYKSTRLRAPGRPPVLFANTLSETTGPVFGHDMIGPQDNDLICNYASSDGAAIGPRIAVHGRVRDENGRVVPGVLIEIWQANSAGRYRHKNDTYLAPLDANFGGAGRTITDKKGCYTFQTVQPGPYPWPNSENAWRPAHIHFSVFGSGFAQRLITQMYFEGDPLIPLCPIVQSLNDPAAVNQLTARLDMDTAISMDRLAYRFDIVLRGTTSTPFENRLEGN